MVPRARSSSGSVSCGAPGSQTSSDLFIKHSDTNMVRGEVLTLELEVQAERRESEGGWREREKVERKRKERRKAERDAAEVRGCR